MRIGMSIIVASMLTSPAFGETPSATDQLLRLLPIDVQRCVSEADPPATDWTRRSQYVAVADGTRLAVDIYLPAGREVAGRFPTVFMSTRYWRASDGDGVPKEYQPWLNAGYAVVIADLRGTGASFGQWYAEYTVQEARDIGFLARWIGSQRWSDGKVVTTGNSYPGTTSLMSAAFGAPAVRAVIPRFSDWDLYEDVGFPGGIKVGPLISGWGKMVRALDLNEPVNGKGVRPVDGPDGVPQLAHAIYDHRRVPAGFDEVLMLVDSRDDAPKAFAGHTMAESGVYNLRAPISASGIPIFGWGSWMDTGIAQGMINRFVTLANPQLSIIGPWIHGGRADADPFKAADAPLEPTQETQRKIDRCLSRAALDDAPSIRSLRSTILYYTMGEGRWHATDAWPVANTQPTRFYLRPHGQLAEKPAGVVAKISYRIDTTSSTAPLNRWMTQMGQERAPDIVYSDRRAQDAKLLTFDSVPLAQELELTGTPMVKLTITSNVRDGMFIAYLEDVAPDGRVTYITEGELNAAYRQLAAGGQHYKTVYSSHSFDRNAREPLTPGQPASLEFQLQPTSVLLPAGHRIRLAIAGADRNTFVPVASRDEAQPAFDVQLGGPEGSSLVLPIVRRGAATQ